MRLERDARALEEDDAPRAVVAGRVAVVGVVERAEILGDADRILARGEILEHARIPHALLAFAVGAVVIEVAELPHERALANAWAADDCDAPRAQLCR